MKNLLLKATLLIILCAFFQTSKAQIYSPYYSGYVGTGVIYYPFGYYQGQIYNGYANGEGYFVMNNGSIYYGNYYSGMCHGPGVFISKYYGYVSGCWNMGTFIGSCYGQANPYEKKQVVSEIIKDVADNTPEPDDEHTPPDVDPEGYKVIPVDPNTPLGKKVLGGMNHP